MSEPINYRALVERARALDRALEMMRTTPQPWPSRRWSEAPTLEEVQAGHIDWMMSCAAAWGDAWMPVRLDVIEEDDCATIVAWLPFESSSRSIDIRWVGPSWPASSGLQIRHRAEWRRCTVDGRPLPLPVWRGPGGEVTTKPHPGESGWVVEEAT